METALPLSGTEIIDRAYASIRNWPGVACVEINAISLRLAGQTSYGLDRRASAGLPAGGMRYREAVLVQMPEGTRWVIAVGRYDDGNGTIGAYPRDLCVFPDTLLPRVTDGGIAVAIDRLLIDARVPVTAVVTAGCSGELYFNGHLGTDVSLRLRAALRDEFGRRAIKKPGISCQYPPGTETRLEAELRQLMLDGPA